MGLFDFVANIGKKIFASEAEAAEKIPWKRTTAAARTAARRHCRRVAASKARAAPRSAPAGRTQQA